jgi:hypothetical protein
MGGATSAGAAPNSAVIGAPSPSAAGAPLTAGQVNQSNAGVESLPSSALPETTATVPPTTSSIAPPQTTSDIAPPPNPSSIAPPPSQSLAPQPPAATGLFTNVPMPGVNDGSFNVATPPQTPPAPSTNGGSNFNVPGWDHP